MGKIKILFGKSLEEYNLLKKEADISGIECPKCKEKSRLIWTGNPKTRAYVLCQNCGTQLKFKYCLVKK